MRIISSPISLLCILALGLTACETPPKKGEPTLLTNIQPVNEAPATAPAPVPLVEAAPLQASPNADISARLARIEQQLAAAQDEIGEMRPKVAKIDLMEQKFKDLSLGLERIDANYGTAATSPVMRPLNSRPQPTATAASMPSKTLPVVKAPVKPPVKEIAVKAPVIKSELAVYALRLGEQSGYTRLVLDAGKSMKLGYDVDNQEKILVVELGNFAWKAENAKSFTANPLVASYKVSKEIGTTRLVVLLKKPVKILRSASLAPDKNGKVRNYLDIAAL